MARPSTPLPCSLEEGEGKPVHNRSKDQRNKNRDDDAYADLKRSGCVLEHRAGASTHGGAEAGRRGGGDPPPPRSPEYVATDQNTKLVGFRRPAEA